MRFGTDGIRGEANKDLTAEVALALGRAAALVLAQDEWFVGWDTRVSSPMLASAFAAGAASASTSVTELGVIPTAGVAFLCRTGDRPGAMVTASHNPFYDNGIKLVGSTGGKLSDELEGRIEDQLNRILDRREDSERTCMVGLVRPNCRPSTISQYQSWLTSRASVLDGSKLRIGLDCAHGASYRIAPSVIQATGASVEVIGVHPDGLNINKECGSTELNPLRTLVRERGCDFGLAFDGDADRVLAVDEDGNTVDGDSIIAMLASRRSRLGVLGHNGVVVTEWSNLGLLRSLRERSIEVEVCEVGDKNVASAMKRTQYTLGGEQSGHIILSDLLPVGDGISTAVEMIGVLVDSAISMSNLASLSMTKLPQAMRNVRVTLPPSEVAASLREQVKAENELLGERGRLVLRPSGTESVVRVMAEAEDTAVVNDLVLRVVELVSAAGRSEL